MSAIVLAVAQACFTAARRIILLCRNHYVANSVIVAAVSAVLDAGRDDAQASWDVKRY
jgi:hypothetical protein